MSLADPAHQKQLSYIASLAKGRDLGDDLALRGRLSAVDDGVFLTVGEASALIDALLKRPALQKGAPAAPGYYFFENAAFVVVEGKTTGKAYAKKLVLSGNKGSWVYAPGMVFKLVDARPLSVEEAAKLGKLHGCCFVCGKTLSDPKSVQAGIGPVCSKKLAF